MKIEDVGGGDEDKNEDRFVLFYKYFTGCTVS